MKAHKTDSGPARETRAAAKKNIEAIYPLSPLQQGMLFHSVREPGSGVYLTQLECTIDGKIDYAAFERAWQEVINRHAALRTGFFWQRSGEPIQIVSRRVAFSVAVQDWRQVPGHEQSSRWQAFVQEDRHRGLNLEAAPLMRGNLVQVANARHRFLWSCHHILLDGWSLPLVLREVFAFYEAFTHGRKLELQSTRPYRDFIAWLRRQDPAEAEQYWREQLAGFDSPVKLPVDRCVGESPAGYLTETLQLSMGSTRELQALAQSHGLTLNTVVQAAWTLLLSRLSGAKDILFGVTVSGRPTELQGVEDIVGLFINTIPLRVRLDPKVRLIDLLKQLQVQNARLRQHEHVPLSELQGWTDVPRAEPLFDSILVFENYLVEAGLTEQRHSAIRVNEIRVHEQTNYPMTVIVAPDDCLSLRIIYDRQRFQSATITRVLGHLRTLLEGMSANPQSGISDLPLLTPDERQQLLVEWNATVTDYARDLCLHQLFEAQVERTPDSTAVVFEDQSLTYAELNAKANQLAHYLRSLGVGPDALVGLCVARSLEMVVGLLGILKAGGAYVALDPSYPKQRSDYILRDTQAQVLVAQESLLEGLPFSSVQTVCIDRDRKIIGRHSQQTPLNCTQAEHLAYVLYTSGSTGKPKGVAITHRSAQALIHWAQSVYTSEELSGVLASTSICFDLSVFELFTPLGTGNCVILAQNALALPTLPAVDKVTLINTVPSAITELIRQDVLPASVRTVNLAGEPLKTVLVDQLYQREGIERVFDLYGPSEDTTYSTYALRVKGGAATIGRPISNTQIFILGPEVDPVPVGIAGELYLGGAGLARGYLSRPALTAERFIPNPFSATPGARLYKTGDLARFLPDGNIEFLGRIDHQVKVRGFRIELGEIEAILVQHPAVREAVVLAREDSPGDKRLVAYLVPSADAEPDMGALRTFLKDKLPDYMVPAAFVFLDGLPLTPNGKVDRKALPAPEGQLALAHDYLAPRTPTEQTLAEIWAEILGVARVGIHDNFFELGGHSLLVTQVVSRLRAAFATELPLRALFEAPTVAALAHVVETARHDSDGLQAPPIVPAARDGALPLSFAQQRLWFLERLEPGRPFYNMPGTVQLQGGLEVAPLERSLNALIARHEALRTAFRTVDGEAVQVIATVLELTLPVIDLTKLPLAARQAQARQLAAEEAQQPFDLAEGPLVRARLLRLAEDDHLLQVTFHHIVSDGWSLGVFVEELATLYRAFVSGQPTPLAPLPIQYADFAHWQRQWLQGEVLEQQLAYWRERLTGLPPLLELPTDRPRPQMQTFRGAHHPITVSVEATKALRVLSREAGATLFMTLLAAFQVLLARYTGQRDFAVGTPIANRNRAETEGLIGFFVNTLVLRADLSENPSFSDLLARTKQMTLGAYAHQDLPFERLVDELQPERDMSHSPLFQVMFALQNALLQPADLPGLKLTPWPLESGTAKFDLTLELAEESNALKGTIEYNTDLFDAATVARLADHFLTLLEGIIQEPQARISQLPLQTTAEREQLLVEWNATQTDFPKDQCIHQLFEAQVEKTPDATAVVFENQSLTYAKLNAQANQLAHHLRGLGVGPDGLVGLCVERSLEMIIGLLGILKAGGAYVPLDPGYPKERLAFMLADCQAPMLLTQSALIDALSAHSAQTLCLDTDWPVISKQNSDNLPNKTLPENLAYVIYTSGSTGRPKGTSIAHRSVVRLVKNTDYVDLSSKQVFLQFAPISFDAATFEIWGSLVNGAKLVVSPPGKLSLEELGTTLKQSGITTLWLTAGLFHLMVDQQLEDLRNVQQLLAGGDVLSTGHVRRTLQVLGRGHVINGYGPTENTTFTCSYRVNAENLVREPLPIGKPIANTTVYILDPELNVVPIGVPGELYTGGAGLARGYLNRPDLTAEKFIPDPFSGVTAARLYKTGDLARYLPDGNIEFLGRIDYQVKVRGFRIELGEIEETLTRHPQVRDAVVVASEDSPGDKRLVAYVVGVPNETPDLSALRAHLKEKLPDYMVPAAFVFLGNLPLTTHGKVDRKALPAPDDQQALGYEYVAPRNPIEQKLADIWAELLRVDRVGILDNFFELGGHSLLVVQLTSLLEKEFNKAGLPVATVFNNPTIAQFASVLSGDEKPVRSSPLVALGREGRSRPFFCVPGADGMVLSLQRLAHHLAPEQSCYGFEAIGLDGRSAPLVRVEDMARRYLDAMKLVQPNGPYLLGGYSFGGWVAFEMALQLRKQGEQVRQLFMIDTKAPQSDNTSRVEWDDLRLIKSIAGLLERHWKIDLNLPYAELASVASREQIDRLYLALQEVDVLPANFGRTQLGALMQVMKTHSRIRYAPTEKYPDGLTLIRASDTRPEDDQDASTPRGGDDDPTLGWNDSCDGPVQIHFVPGDHSTMVLEPDVQGLVEKLKALLLTDSAHRAA